MIHKYRVYADDISIRDNVPAKKIGPVIVDYMRGWLEERYGYPEWGVGIEECMQDDETDSWSIYIEDGVVPIILIERM